MKLKRAVLYSLFISLFAATLAAQTPTGTLEGTVVDQTGGAVASATVRIVNLATNEAKQLTTDSGGRFTLLYVNPGTYTVTVTATGFGPAEERNIKVDVGQVRTLPFTLTVGQVSEKVEVNAEATPLDISTSTIGTVIDNRKVNDLPLLGSGPRNPFSLAELTPAVNNVGGASTPHMAGSRNAVNEEQLDGITNIMPENNVGNNVAAYTPIVDSIQEFNVQINSTSAEYGRFGGGVINVVTKSGTNQWHGGLFFFDQATVLDANDFFANRGGQPRPNVFQHEYGGTVGGPVAIPHVYDGHNKTFAFFGFEGTNWGAPATETDTVPIAPFRTGDFSLLNTTIYDPTTVHALSNGNLVRNPFPNNIIPQANISSIGTNVIGYFPSPNCGGAGAQTANYCVAGTNKSDDDHFDSRIDHNFTDNWRMFVRFSHDWADNTPLSDYGSAASAGWSGPDKGGAWSVAMDHTLTISPTLIADFRYGLSMSYVTRVAFDQGFNPTTELGLAQDVTDLAATHVLLFPRFDIQNTNGLGTNGYVPLIENPLSHDIVGNLTKIHGAHTIKFGGEFRILRINFTQYGEPDGQYEIDQTWTQYQTNANNGTGSSYASLLLGLPSSSYGGQVTNDPTAADQSHYMAWYLQDDWKVTRKLTVNLGLRWETEFPRTERFNRLSYWDANLPSPLAGKVPASACPSCANLMGQMEFVTTSGSQYGRAQGPTQWHDFGPRVGFAYNVSNKTVIRSGFGLVYAPSALQAAGTSGAQGMEGFSLNNYINTTYDNGKTIRATLANPFPSGLQLPVGVAGGASTDIGNSIGESFFANYRNPYSILWNFNIQRELPGQMTIEAGYLGNHSLFLVDGDPGLNYNQLPASYASLGNQLYNQVANPFYGVINNASCQINQQTVQYDYLLAPYPQYCGVQSFRKPTATSMYNAWTLRLNKRFSSGLTFLVSFTGAKLMDDSAAAVTYLGPVSSTREDQYNNRLEWSVSPQDVSRTIVASFVYDLPFGKGKKFANEAPRGANLLISGWQANGIITWSTGTPIVLTGANNSMAALFAFGQRPDNNGHSAKLSDPTIAEWFNTSVFSQPPLFTFGNTSRTLPDVRNPGVSTANLSLFKNNYFGPENKYNLQFRVEAQNALNHPQFGGPDVNITDGTFGQINGSANPPRQIQLAVKFNF
jgi:hypothetical protein